MTKLTFLIFLLIAGNVNAQKISRAEINEWANDQMATAMTELNEALSIPNDALYPQHVEQNIKWCYAAFEQRGFTIQQLSTPVAPLLLAEKKFKKAKKTVLFYIQIDGQPVDSSKWNQESPYIPVLKEKRGNEWIAVDPAEAVAALNDDWRIFARSASDAKGPVIMFLAAMDIIEQQKIYPDYNIKVIMDLEEELGSPNLPGAVEHYADQLAADHFVILDGPRHITNVPTLTFGARGIATITLTVFGPRVSQHSGHYGNYVPNPALRLSQLLASMKDEEGRVTIPGFYDGVVISEADLIELSRVPDNEDQIMRKIGISSIDRVAETYQESIQYPSLNIRGMSAAWVGSQSRTIIPATATAELDLRLVPETDGNRQIELVRKHIEQLGYHFVTGTPTDEQRSKFDKLISFESTYSYKAFRTPINSPTGEWLTQAMNLAFGSDPVKIRIAGGSIPISPFVSTLGVPAVSVPTVNPDNNQHSPNENIRVGNITDGIKTCVAILATPLK